MGEENRPNSPYLELIGDTHQKSHQKYITSRDKIHRIRCMVGYYATVSIAYSPNEIWLQLHNHVANKLVLSRLNPPPLERNLGPNAYVMAPINDTKLGRARIISVQNNSALIRFIDTGKIDSRSLGQLYEMNNEFRTHPWQAIHVTLHNIHPENGEFWTTEETESLSSVLAEFSHVWVEPQLSAKVINDDSEPIRVLLNGLTPEEVEMIETTSKTSYEDIGESITEKYVLSYPNALLASKRIVDAFNYTIYPIDG
jgi:hypothetical protein